MTSPVNGLSEWQALSIEGITTGLLILVVCAVWDPRNGHGESVPLKFLVIIFLTSVVVVSTCTKYYYYTYLIIFNVIILNC